MEDTPQFTFDQVVVMQQVSGMDIGPLDGRLGNIRETRAVGDSFEYLVAYDSGDGVVGQDWFNQSALLSTDAY